MARARYVILGDGAAGITAAQTLRTLDPQCEIKVVSDDPHPAYFRAALTNYMLGELRDEQVWAVPPTFFADVGAERVHARVTSVDAQRSHVWLHDGTPVPYDALLIGTGARSRTAPFEGANLAGVCTLRTLQDTRWIMDCIALGRLRRAVVVGGGPLALEWALAMRERGVKVTMLIRERGMMTGALDEVAQDLLTARLRQGGLDVRVQEEVAAALPDGEGNVGSVRTRSGEVIPCEVVAVAIGVVCNTEMLQGSGIALGRRGGVAVDSRMRSSVPNVYAAGDVAELDGNLSQLWEPARLEAQVAASNMARRDRVYAPGVLYFATRLFDLDFASVGAIGKAAGAEEILDVPRGGGRIAYRKLMMVDGRLVGALMLGDRDARVRQRGRLFKRLIDERVDVRALGRKLLDPAFDLGAWLRSRSLVEKPNTSMVATSVVADAAELRGTQHVKLGELAAAMSVFMKQRVGAGGGGAPQAIPARVLEVSTPEAAPMSVPANGTVLSIGLKQAAASALLRPSPVTAFLEGAGHRFPLEGAVISIGRDPRGGIVLSDPGVSTVHAQITAYGGGLFLRDMGSRNGTWVNGKQVTVPHRLLPADRVTVGTTELTFRQDSTAPVSARVHDTSVSPPRAPGTEMMRPQVYSPAPVVSVAGAAPSTTTSTSSPAVLVGQSGAFRGMRFVVAGSPSTIGRELTTQIRIEDLSISRRHALLSFVSGSWHVSDLASSAGTTHNGVRLVAGHEVVLRDGDTLQLGAVSLQFHASAVSAQSAVAS